MSNGNNRYSSFDRELDFAPSGDMSAIKEQALDIVITALSGTISILTTNAVVKRVDVLKQNTAAAIAARTAISVGAGVALSKAGAPSSAVTGTIAGPTMITIVQAIAMAIAPRL